MVTWLESNALNIVAANVAVFCFLMIGAPCLTRIRSIPKQQRFCDLLLLLSLIGYAAMLIPHRGWIDANKLPFSQTQIQTVSRDISNDTNEQLPTIESGRAASVSALGISKPATIQSRDHESPIDTSETSVQETRRSQPRLQAALIWCTAWYLIGSLMVSIWLIMGSIRLRWIRRHAIRLPLNVGYEVYQSRSVAHPCCCGLIDRVILVPEVVEPSFDWSHVIRHESAHLERNDPWSRAIANLVMPLFYWNPVYWFVRYRAIRASEFMADELAVHGIDRAEYAQGLVHSLRRMHETTNQRVDLTSSLVAISAQTLLFQRIRVLLEQLQPVGAPPTLRWLSVFVVLGTTLLASIVSAIGTQQDDPPPKDAIAGNWIAQEDKSFAIASTDRTIPGVVFEFIDPETKLHTGKVVDEKDQPVADAEVWFTGIWGRVPLRERTRTKSDGTYAIKIPTMETLGAVSWTATAVHGNDGSHSVYHPAPDGVTINLVRGRTLTLRAKQSKLAATQPTPITQFTVHLEDGRIVPSDANGVCVVHGLLPVLQYVGLSSPGYAYQYWMMDFADERDVELTSELVLGGTVRGVVRDTEGHPVGWNVVYGPTSEKGTIAVGRTFTNEQGGYELSGIRLGRKNFVSAFSHSTGQVQYSEQELISMEDAKPKTCDFRVTPGRIQQPEPGIMAMQAQPARGRGFVKGRVLLPDGTPCKQFRLRVFPSEAPLDPTKGGGWAASFESIGITFASSDGSFLFSDLQVGTNVKLVVSAEGYRDDFSDPVVAVSAEEADGLAPIQFELEPTTGINIRVESPDGDAVPGARVALYRIRSDETIYPYFKERYLFQGETDARGRLVVPDVTLAFGRWVVETDGYSELQIPWRGESEVLATLKKSVTLHLKFSLNGESKNKFAFALLGANHQVVQQVKDIETEGGEWIIPNLSPEKYFLIVDSSEGRLQFRFDDAGNRRFEQPLDLSNQDGQVHEVTFELKPFDP